MDVSSTCNPPSHYQLCETMSWSWDSYCLVCILPLQSLPFNCTLLSFPVLSLSFSWRIALPIISHPPYTGLHKDISQDSHSPCNHNEIFLPQSCEIPGWGRLSVSFPSSDSAPPTQILWREIFSLALTYYLNSTWLENLSWGLMLMSSCTVLLCFCCAFISGC